MEMTFQQITYFYYTAKHLSFSKAASLCYVAQTAVSKQIQNLEDELGCQLFIRKGRQIELTPAGSNLYVYAEKIIKLWDDCIVSTKKIGESNFEKTSINVGYWGCIESTNLTYIFDGFLESEPGCRIYYMHLTLNNVISCLKNETVDLIIVPQAHIENCGGIHYCTLFSSPVGIVMNKDNVLALKPVLYASDLLNETFIQRILAASSGLTAVQEACWNALGFRPGKYIEVNEYKSAVMMVSNNMGVTLSPDYVEEIKSAGLVYRHVEGLDIEEKMALGYRKGVEKPVVKRFLRHIEAKVKKAE